MRGGLLFLRMRVLAIDTSTPDMVVGVVDTPTVPTSRQEITTLAQVILEDSRQHNELLIPTTQEVLSQAQITFADLQAIVVGCGPGPFTGLRVGMATAAALGDALGIPVYGVHSHDAIATFIADAPTALVITDARRREVYYSAYKEGTRVAGPEVCSPASLDLAADLGDAAGTVGVVSAPQALFEQLPQHYQTTRVLHRPEAAALVAVADLEAPVQPLVPLYLRRPDAKEPAAKPRSAAIPEVDLG